MSFESEQGHPAWYPFAFIGLCLGIVGFILTAIYTQNWVWLLGALGCYAAIVSK